MGKALFIAEKPSVAMEFAKVLHVNGNKRNGYVESDRAVVTWCVGHLVTMSYPEKYDEKYKKWILKDLPFLPNKYKYEVIKSVKNQFDIIKNQMEREDISTIYVCTDSGREGEYIYRLIDEMIGVKNKDRKRVWIDSQTEEEIKKGIKNAKKLQEYDNLSNSAYLRAKEDYLMGINFSRLLTLSYGRTISNYLGEKHVVIAVGRVMTCVLGMIVKREREIREFIKTPYYKIRANFNFEESLEYDGEWKAIEGSSYYLSKLLFKDIGFLEKEKAENFIDELKQDNDTLTGIIKDVKKKRQIKKPPLLYNLAELQNECSKRFKLSPDETLKIAQNLYEKKMLTYPRTDARVLSTAVSKEIYKNLKGLLNIKSIPDFDEKVYQYTKNILENNLYRNLEKTKYVNDKAITDHYAIIPTGQGIQELSKLPDQDKNVFLLVVKRFLAIFCENAIYNKLSIETKIKEETFFTNVSVCIQEGYLDLLNEKEKDEKDKKNKAEILKRLKKGQIVNIIDLSIKQSETTPPKRYNSGAMILAMENAGKLIEDDELREEIRGSGIGTSATRAEILNKLGRIKYINLNKKTQILTPTVMGEMIYDTVNKSIPSLLKPELTASWEKGLTMISNGEISPEEYMQKLESYIKRNTQNVLLLNNKMILKSSFSNIPINKNQMKNIEKNKKRKSKNSLGKCIACETGDIIENSKAFFCSNWRDGCKFSIWKNSLEPYGKKVSKELVKTLLENKKIENFSITLPQTGEKCKASLEFRGDNSGALELKNLSRIKME